MQPKKLNPLVRRLNDAHRGYLYQDIAVAYLLALAHYNGATSITVDVKEHEGDVFDDVTIVHDGSKTKRQIKSSSDPHKELSLEHLTTRRSGIRLDDIVNCFRSASDKVADEYRLCCTWKMPSDGELTSLLVPATEAGSFLSYETQCLKLHREKLWPKEGEFILDVDSLEKTLVREDVMDFAKRFVIESDWPQISGDLSNPGALENILLEFLSVNIGVGHYPNQNRSVVDVAARLILIANGTRVSGHVINPNSIVQELGLRTDFGRIAQAFPIDQQRLVNCTDIDSEIKKQIQTDGLVLLTGPPGAGKSWSLTKIANNQITNDFVTAIHYCHLSPVDDLATSRITINTMYANLIAGILEKCPMLERKQTSLYSGEREALIELLHNAFSQTTVKRIVLIIDGLDHIARVISHYGAPDSHETRLVDELVSLPSMAGLTVLMGSQPGPHCEILAKHARTIPMQTWMRNPVKSAP